MLKLEEIKLIKQIECFLVTELAKRFNTKKKGKILDFKEFTGEEILIEQEQIFRKFNKNNKFNIKKSSFVGTLKSNKKKRVEALFVIGWKELLYYADIITPNGCVQFNIIESDRQETSDCKKLNFTTEINVD